MDPSPPKHFKMVIPCDPFFLSFPEGTEATAPSLPHQAAGHCSRSRRPRGAPPRAFAPVGSVHLPLVGAPCYTPMPCKNLGKSSLVVVGLQVILKVPRSSKSDLGMSWRSTKPVDRSFVSFCVLSDPFNVYKPWLGSPVCRFSSSDAQIKQPSIKEHTQKRTHKKKQLTLLGCGKSAAAKQMVFKGPWSLPFTGV